MVSKRKNRGQVALILVLVMTVVAGTVVAISGRTSIETRLQAINLDSSQAMVAAESGLEQALRNQPSGAISGDLDANTSFTVGKNQLSSSQSVYKGVRRGETIELTISGSTGSPTAVNVYWSPVGTDTSFSSRALYISKLDAGKLTDYAFNTDGSDGFTKESGAAAGYAYSASIPISATTTMIRVSVLGGDVDFGFSPNVGTLATQLIQRPVVGTVKRGTGAGLEKIQYGIDYQQSVSSELPEIFEYTLFSGGSISQ